MMQPQGAALRTPSFDTVDIRTTGIGRTWLLMLGFKIISYHQGSFWILLRISPYRYHSIIFLKLMDATANAATSKTRMAATSTARWEMSPAINSPLTASTA